MTLTGWDVIDGVDRVVDGRVTDDTLRRFAVMNSMYLQPMAAEILASRARLKALERENSDRRGGVPVEGAA